MTHRNWTINKAVVAAEVFDGETVVIHFDSGRYYSLGGAGSWIWQCLEQAVGAADIAAAAGTNADSNSIATFLDRLAEEGLIIAADGAASDLPPLRSAWETPSIEIFSDLAELIKLDPVHEVDAAAGWPHRKERVPD